MTRSPLGFAVCLVVACGTKAEDPVLRPAPVTPGSGSSIASGSGSGSGSAAPAPPKDARKGDRDDPEWTPAEFKAGMAKWKDTGVYVDGKPVAFMTWGELPIGLKPTWVKDKVNDTKRPGTSDPGWKWSQQRFYKFTDYFKALGIDIASIKEVHLYGPRPSQVLIATQRDLSSPLVDKFMFRFGTNTGGKPIPAAPGEFGNGKTADKVTSVQLYIKKKPPTLIRNEGMELDGQMQKGVPYYGDPIRGGVRLYLDDRLVGIIKRQELDPKKAVKTATGDLSWKLADVFAAQGIDTKKVVDVWVIREDRRKERFAGDKLAAMTFTAGAQAHGGVKLDDKIKANAIAMHTRELRADELPQVTEWDE